MLCWFSFRNSNWIGLPSPLQWPSVYHRTVIRTHKRSQTDVFVNRIPQDNVQSFLSFGQINTQTAHIEWQWKKKVLCVCYICCLCVCSPEEEEIPRIVCTLSCGVRLKQTFISNSLCVFDLSERQQWIFFEINFFNFSNFYFILSNCESDVLVMSWWLVCLALR